MWFLGESEQKASESGAMMKKANDNGLQSTLFRAESQKVQADIFLASRQIIGYSSFLPLKGVKM
ncbi:MAG: hypothetical protein ACK5PS_02450 [Desulfopila sp.]